MLDDPTVQWRLTNTFGIQLGRSEVWHSGHVNDIVALPDDRAIVVATHTGGVWVINEGADPIPLSNDWDNPDVKCISHGSDSPLHMFAGCTLAYDSAEKRSYKEEIGSAPVIMESDPSKPAPLLNWNPLSAALPITAGRITRIVVIPRLRRIVVACAAVLAPDTGGIFWSIIPPTRFSAGDPPRPPFVWKQAQIVGVAAAQGFWDLAVAATHDKQSRENLEDKHAITLVAGGFRGGGLLVGQWNSADDLVFNRAAVTSDKGIDMTAWSFDSCGTTSVSSCEVSPNVLYAACAWPDGRLKQLLRSKDGGRHWLDCRVQMEGSSDTSNAMRMHAGDLGADWTNCIAAHPQNPSIAALGWVGGPFLTLNAGASWHLVDSPHVHSDLHALHFAKELRESIDYLFVGSDGGVARISLEGFPGEHGPSIRSDYNRRLPTLQCYSRLFREFTGTIDASPFSHEGLLVAGLQDNGNVTCRYRTGPTPWGHVDQGDGGPNAHVRPAGYLHNIVGGPVIATAPLSPAVQVAVIPVTLPLPGDPAGLKASIVEAVVKPKHKNAAGELLVAVAAAPNAPNTVFGLYTKGGAVPPPYQWESIGTIPAKQWISALCSFQGDQVFVGSGEGKMYRLDVATGSVVEQVVKLPKPSPSSQMAGGQFVRIVAFGGASLFATLSGASETKLVPSLSTPAKQGYVMRLDADTWNPTSATGLPNEFLYGFDAIAFPNSNSGFKRALMAATDDAVYLSREDGETWVRASWGLPRRAHCADLRFVIQDVGSSASVYLGTFGRSVWVADLA